MSPGVMDRAVSSEEKIEEDEDMVLEGDHIISIHHSGISLVCGCGRN